MTRAVDATLVHCLRVEGHLVDRLGRKTRADGLWLTFWSDGTVEHETAATPPGTASGVYGQAHEVAKARTAVPAAVHAARAVHAAGRTPPAETVGRGGAPRGSLPGEPKHVPVKDGRR